MLVIYILGAIVLLELYLAGIMRMLLSREVLECL